MAGKETKIFDPADGFSPITNLYVATDSSVVKRGNQWWMFLAGKVTDAPAIQLFSASLPEGAPLTAVGWRLTAETGDPSRIALLAGQEISREWDLKGGRHCPSYVRGWDSYRKEWVERIYYAGGAENVGGPYTIGYLEWDGTQWQQERAPAFTANEEWEHASVYEPNLIYADGLWRMWYVAGSNQEDYLVHGYAESADGRSNWSKHTIVFPPEQNVFDFCVLKTREGYEAVFSRVWLGKSGPPPETGLWWCYARTPSPDIADWSTPLQIMTAEDQGWHAGPWKPSFQYSETQPDRMLVFFDGLHRAVGPYALTLGCLEMMRPGSV